MGSIREAGDDHDPSCLTFFGETKLSWMNCHVRQVTAAFSPGRAAGDPLTQKLILPRVFGKTSAAAVIDLARRLEKQEAAINIDRIHSPPQGVSCQRDIIFGGVITKKRQSKAILALK